MKTRIEKDSLGTKAVSASAYYGAETARALENFPISGQKFHPVFLKALAQIKKACALAHASLKQLPRAKASAIVRVCDEILKGKWQDHFVTDVLQSGAGVSAHMNANEMIANRALELMGQRKGSYEFLDPHDDVNQGQSTNDVVPTAMRLAVLELLKSFYVSSRKLEKSLAKKAREFRGVIKSGRTHLQDAVPITLGQEFGGWARQIEKGRDRIERLSQNLRELGIGGSAVGTGLNTSVRYRKTVIENLKRQTGFPVESAESLFEVMESDADFAGVSGGLRAYALSLIQISNDLRLLSSGPKTGLAEIQLPVRQPGSSMMPGKVNPVMPEAASQAGFQVIGNDTTIAWAVSAGQLELNVMRPVIAHNLLQSIEILKNVTALFADLCISGITAHKKRCHDFAEASHGIAAALNPYIGYQKAAACVKESVKTGKTLRQVVLQKGYLKPEDLNRILSPENLTQPQA